MADYFRRHMWFLWVEETRRGTGSRRGRFCGTTHYITCILYIMMNVQSHTLTIVFIDFSLCNRILAICFNTRTLDIYGNKKRNPEHFLFYTWGAVHFIMFSTFQTQRQLL